MSLRANLPLLLAVLALAAISLSVIFSINRVLATNQLVFWILGASLFLAITQTPKYFLEKFTIHVYIVSIISLAMVLLIGEEIRGATRWIDLGIFQFQPSEVAKVATIIALSAFYAKRSARDLTNVVKSIAIVAPAFLLIFRQPDIGSTMAIIAVWGGINYAANINVKTILVFFVLSAAVFSLTVNLLEPYQKQRLTSFINPQQDPLGAGYNIIQSKIAIGSGLIFGRGLGRGSQSQLNFLPEPESDFIFASLVEELGLLGGTVTILLLIFILLRIHATPERSVFEGDNRFSKLLKAGTISLLMYQITVNICMNLGLIPITGITLPLVSYGGSSLITTLLLLGIVSSQKR